MTMTLKETRMPNELLTEVGVPHGEAQPISIDDINIQESLRNQARIVPLDDGIIDRYTTAMKEGAIFPPIVVRDTGIGYVVLDGNHRVGAAMAAGIKQLDAFIGREMSDLQALAVAYEANAKHGLPSSDTERMEHALHLTNLGVPVTKAAEKLGVGISALQGRRSAHLVTQICAKEGLNVGSIPSGALVRIHNLREPELMVAFARMQLKLRFTTPVVSDHVTAINKLPHSARMNYIDELLATFQEKVKESVGGLIGPKTMSATVKMRGVLTQCETLSTEILNLEERDFEKIRRVRDWLDSLLPTP